MKLTLNEVKLLVAEMIDEAKKKKEKAAELKKRGPSIEAYGLYDEAFDFAAPLGAANTYAQQGAANWGPYTSPGLCIDSSFRDTSSGHIAMHEGDERALRALVREVIQNGLVPSNSAWAPLLERNKKDPCCESPWEAAGALFEAWYDRPKQSSKKSEKEHVGFSKLKGTKGKDKKSAERKK